MKVNCIVLFGLMYMNHGIMGQLTKDTTINSPSNTVATPTTTTLSITSPLIDPTPTPPSQSGPVPCADQPVFELCLKNQDNYINGCRTEEYACLCRWHTSKLSCYDNCPLDAGKESEAGIVKHMCSQPGANVTLPSQSYITPSSTILPSATDIAPSSTLTNASTNSKSTANPNIHCPNEIYLASLLLFITGFLI